MPASSGNGLAMRGWSFLEAYAATHDVHLIVMPLSGSGEVSEEVRNLCLRVDVLPSRLYADPVAGIVNRLPALGALAPAGRQLPSLCRYRAHVVSHVIQDVLAQFPFDMVHVQRLYLAPVVEPLLDRPGRPFTVLDLDDDEGQTFLRLAALYELRGDKKRGQAHAQDGRLFTELADAVISKFDRVAVCSQSDAERLSALFPAARFTIVPNAPPQMRPVSAPERDIDLLFVATLGYLPNLDGAEWLVDHVLPLLPSSTRTWLVGPCPADLQRRMSMAPGVTVTGRVDDLAPFYARAKRAVVPLRAGGGTRIKILEAVAHGVPVVSTRMGAEGLGFREGEHLLLADSPADFAAACGQSGGEERAQAALNFLAATGGRQQIQDRIRRLAMERAS